MRDIITKYTKKIKNESIIKSAISGSSLGISIGLIVAIISIIVDYQFVLLSVILTIIVSIICSFIFYYKVYKIDVKQIATRLDELGLHERVITALEYEEVDSYIIKAQKEDTIKVLEQIKQEQIKMKFNKLPIALVIILSLLSINFNVISVVSHESNKVILPNVEPLDPSEEYIMIENLMIKIRVILNDAEITNELRIELHLMVDLLELDLPFYETYLEKISRMQETQTLLMNLVRAEINGLSQVSIAVLEVIDKLDTRMSSTTLEDLYENLENWFEEEDEEEEEEEQEEEEQEDNESDGNNDLEDSLPDNVIDGNTDYEVVFPDSYEEALKLLQSGLLSEEEAKIIADYFGILDPKN